MKKKSQCDNDNAGNDSAKKERSFKEEFEKDVEKIGQNMLLEIAKEMTKMKEKEVAVFQRLLISESNRYALEMERRLFDHIVNTFFKEKSDVEISPEQKQIDTFMHDITRKAFVNFLESLRKL